MLVFLSEDPRFVISVPAAVLGFGTSHCSLGLENVTWRKVDDSFLYTKCCGSFIIHEAVLLVSQKNPDQRESQKVSILCIARDFMLFLATFYMGLIALCSMLGGGGDFMAQTTFELPPGKV